MTYVLKAGEYVGKDGKLYGWTGEECLRCGKTGEEPNEANISCRGCGGTGEQHGLMPIQPTDLPSNTE